MTTETLSLPKSFSEHATTVLRYLAVIGTLYVLIAAVNMLSSALAFATLPDGLMASLESPIFAIASGILITILLQSSSASTAVIIALAAAGSIDLPSAVFLVMGANIGTTVTNSAVALGYVRDKKMFATTFGAGTVHDFFNLFAVIIFGILEYFTAAISRTAAWLSNVLYGQQSENIVTTTFVNISDTISEVFKIPAQALVELNVHSLLIFVLAIILILGSIAVLTRLLKSLHTPVEHIEEASRDMMYTPQQSPMGQLKAILSGAATTAVVQSSSVTTSAAVVGVGTRRYTVDDIYPFIAGANIGTTLTAFLVALMTGSEVALAVALSHVLFNVLGVIVLFIVPVLKDLPLSMAKLMIRLVHRSRLFAAGYIALFITIPALILLLHK